MSVLIKGISMPESCSKCILYGEFGCPFIGPVGYCLTENRRNERCPLVEIPPHGRLIDADALKEKHHWTDAYYEIEYVEVDDIEDAPTIIEAEDEV